MTEDTPDEQIKNLAEADFHTLLKERVGDDMLGVWARNSVLYHSMNVTNAYKKWGCVRFKNRVVEAKSAFQLDDKSIRDCVFDIIAGLSNENIQTVSIAEIMARLLVNATEPRPEVVDTYTWAITKDYVAWVNEPTPYQRMLNRKTIIQNVRPLDIHDTIHTAAAILNLDQEDFYEKIRILNAALRRIAATLKKK